MADDKGKGSDNIDNANEDDLLQAQFPHMQPMTSTAVVGPGDRTNGGTNKELQDVDPMFPTSPPQLMNNQVTSTTPTEDIVTLTAAATSNKQFPHSSQQAVEKGDNKNSKDTPSDEITLPKLGVSEAKDKDDDHEETKTEEEEEEEEEDTRSDEITLPKLGVSEAKDKDDDHEETKTEEEEEEEIKDDSRNVTRSNGATTADMVSAPVTEDDDSKETKGGGNEPISPSSVSNVDLNEIIDVRQIQTYAVMELYRSI